MRIIALITAIGILAMLFTSYWVLSIILYVLMGIIWLKHESSRSVSRQRIGYVTNHGTFVLFVFAVWPLMVIVDYCDTRRIISKDERYVASDGNHLIKFPDRKSAVKVALNRAKETNEREMVIDQTIRVKQLGTIQNKSWFVYPDGRVEKLPRYFIGPWWYSFLEKLFAGKKIKDEN